MSPVRAKNEPSGSPKRLSPRASSSIWISNPVCTATKATLFGGSTGSGAGSGRGDVAAPAPLAQQFVDEGFMNTEQSGDLGYGSDVTIHGVDDSCTKVQ